MSNGRKHTTPTLPKELQFASQVGWAVVQLVGFGVWVEGRVEREVGVGTARAGEGGLRPK
jgi:hypothetical protein